MNNLVELGRQLKRSAPTIAEIAETRRKDDLTTGKVVQRAPNWITSW